MNMRRVFDIKMLVAFLTSLTLLSIPAVLAQADDVTVTVSVTASSEITVLPASVAFGSLGVRADSSTTGIDIKNTGSNAITNLYANVSRESSNPLGTDVASNYNAGSVVMIRNSSNATFYHAGRTEWNLTTDLNGETLSLGTGVTKFGRGWYRNKTGDYLWKVENGTSTNGACNATGATFTIKNTAESNSPSGSAGGPGSTARDFSAGASNVAGTAGTVGNPWMTFTVASAPLANYCVAVNNDCTRVVFYKYDRVTFPSCANAYYLRTASLAPGEIESATVIASMPAGIPDGALTSGTLTFVGT